jgi:hypothetical protein
MTPGRKKMVIILTIVIAATRLLALASSFFDWDEAQFILGVRAYDVAHHAPHPPGYPLFIAAAKGLAKLGFGEFGALRAVVTLGAMLLFPALFFLARELGFGFTTSVCGAALFAFLPNVWIHGGTAFSDVPATAMVFLACALLLRGRRDNRAYLLGAIALAIAAGIRPMSLLAGAVPALLATWHRVRDSAWTVVAAIAIGAAIVIASYGGAALASESVAAYRDAVRVQSEWVRNVDSFRNPTRPPLHEVAKMFFLWPVQQRAQMVAIALLALISGAAAIVRRRVPQLLLMLIFAPVALMTWLNLDIGAASRYAIAYMGVHALLAADGAAVLARGRTRVQIALCGAIVLVFAVWSWPALQLQRTSDAPPVAAMKWIRTNVAQHDLVYVNANLGPIALVVLPNHHRVWFEHPGDIELSAHHAWVVDLKEAAGARNFLWPRTNPLWKIVRRRNFEASAGRVAEIVVYGKGWYGEERGRRWMARRSVTSLPPMPPNGVLQLRMYVPPELQKSQTIEVRMNGVVVDRFSAVPEKRWVIPSRATPNVLQITASNSANAKINRGGETADASLRIDELRWTPQR